MVGHIHLSQLMCRERCLKDEKPSMRTMMMMMRRTVAIQEAARVVRRRRTASGFSFAARTRNTCKQ